MVTAAKPYAWECDTVLPEQITEHIDRLLTMAATCHQEGIDMRHVFVGIPAGNEKAILIDTSGMPPAIIPSWTMMALDNHNCIAVVMCTEGYALPPERADQFYKNRAPGEKISDQSDAYEILLVCVETALGTWAGQTRILGEHPHRSLEGVIKLDKAQETGGRYNNLLPANRMKDPASTMSKVREATEFIAQNGVHSAMED